MSHSTEPCGWTVDICDGCCDDELDLLPSGQVELVKQMAVGFLWSATGRRYGLCEKTYRPCRRTCGDFWGGLPMPFRISGSWVNLTCGTCTSSCGCSTVSEVVIPNTHSVTQVRVDGVDLVPSGTVAVYDHARIIRTDGGTWPMCQDLSVVDGVGAWSITVEEGTPVPPGGSIVAGILACEFAKACMGSDGCRLPRRIQTISRQGVSVAFHDRFEGLSQLRTGLYEVDAWVEANRSGKWMAPSITSPDLPEDPPELTWPVL